MKTGVNRFGNQARVSLRSLPPGVYYAQVFSFSGAPVASYGLEFQLPGADRLEGGENRNDSSDNATELWSNPHSLVLQGQQHWSGMSIDSPNDVDWYRFTTTGDSRAGHNVRVGFQRRQGDLQVQLHSADGGVISESSSSWNNEYLSLAGQPEGTYYVSVRGVTDSVQPSYGISINVPNASTSTVAGRFEPNNSREEAHRIANEGGLTILGSQQKPLEILQSDQDWYRVDVTDDAQYGDFAAIVFDHQAGDLELSLFDASGTPIPDSNGTGPGNLHFVSLQRSPGTYYLRVHGRDGVSNPLYYLALRQQRPPAPDVIDSSTLSALSVGGPVSALSAQGSLLEEATRLGSFDDLQSILGQSLHDSDVDRFQFAIEHQGRDGDQILVEVLDSVLGLSTVLRDSNGQTVRTGEALAGGNRLRLAGLSSGSYMLEVSGALTNYDLHFGSSNSSTAYPNGDQASATVLDVQSGLTTRQFRGNRLSEAWYQFKLTEGATAGASHSVRLAYDATAVDLELSLVRADGTVLLDSSGDPRSSRSRSGVEVVSAGGLSDQSGPIWIRIVQHGETQARTDFDLQLVMPNAEPSDWAEPNQDSLSAFPLSTLSGNQIINDLSLDTITDADWFTFESVPEPRFTPDHSIVVSGSHRDDQFTVRLFDSEKTDHAMIETTSLRGVATIWLQEIESTGHSWLLEIEGEIAGMYSITFDLPELPHSDWAETHGANADNDTPANSLDLGAIDGALLVEDLNLRDINDVDYVGFEITSTPVGESFASVALVNAEGDAVAQLLDAEENVLSTIEMGSHGTQTLSLEGLAVGRYYLKISSLSSTVQPYQLLLIASGVTQPDFTEGNDSPSSAYVVDTTTRCSGVNPFSCGGVGSQRIQSANYDQNFSDQINERFIQSEVRAGRIPSVDVWSSFQTAFENYVRFQLMKQMASNLVQRISAPAETVGESSGANNSQRIENRTDVIHESSALGGPRQSGLSDRSPNQTQTLALLIAALLVDKTPGIEVSSVNVDRRTNTLIDPPDFLGLSSFTGSNGQSVVRLDDLTIHESSDVDWIRFTLTDPAQADQRIRIVQTGVTDQLNAALFGAGDVDSQLASVLLDQEREADIPLVGLAAGDYLLRFSGDTNVTYSVEIGLRPRYDFVPDWAEPNDVASSAYQIPNATAGEIQVLEGLSIDTSGDEDWFQFSLDVVASRADRLSVLFDGGQSDVDLYLYATGATDGPALRQARLRDSDRESISLDGLPKGAYVLRVSSNDDRPLASYAMEIRLPSSVVEPDRFEPNDRPVQAIDVDRLGITSRLGELSLGEGDTDLFAFTMATDGQSGHRFRMVGSGIEVRLLDESAAPLRSQSSVNGEATLSLANLSTGSYFIEITSTGEVDDYSIDWDLPRLDRSIDQWTVFVYMTAADLERYAESDINELEAAVARLPSDVNVLVLLDQSSGVVRDTRGGFREATRFATAEQDPWGDVGYARVMPDLDLERIATRFDRIGERNTGDAATMTEFLEWGISVAPAQQYAMVVWDHGSGLEGTNRDEESSGDMLTTQELVAAIENVDSEFKLDLLTFEACLMAMTEVSSALSDVAGIVVASQENIAGGGFNHISAFDGLSGFRNLSSDRSPSALASSIMRSFTEQYVGRYKTDTLSVVDTSVMTELEDRLREFVDEAIGLSQADLGPLRDAIAVTPVYGGDSNALRDLRSFMVEIAGGGVTEEIRNRADLVRQTLDRAVAGRTLDHRNSGGLSILLPALGQSHELERFIAEYRLQHPDFVAKTRWDEFLLRLIDGAGGAPARADWMNEHWRPERAMDLGVLDGVLRLPTFDLARLPGLQPDRWFAFELTEPTESDAFTFSSTNASYRVTLYRGEQVSELIEIDTLPVSSAVTAVLRVTGLPSGKYWLQVTPASTGEGEQGSGAQSTTVSIRWNTEVAPSASNLGNTSVDKAFVLGSTVESFLYSDFVTTAQPQFFEIQSPRLSARQSRTFELRIDRVSAVTASIRHQGAEGFTENDEPGSILPSTTTEDGIRWQIPSGGGERFLLEVASADEAQRFALWLQDAGDALVSWQNPRNRFDVTNEGQISSIDALVILNRIARSGTQLPWISSHPNRYYDTSGDGNVTPIDALIVLNAVSKSIANDEPNLDALQRSIVDPLTQITQIYQPTIQIKDHTDEELDVRDHLFRLW